MGLPFSTMVFALDITVHILFYQPKLSLGRGNKTSHTISHVKPSTPQSNVSSPVTGQGGDDRLHTAFKVQDSLH